jgi:[protein-PII] uridylyltransferase
MLGMPHSEAAPDPFFVAMPPRYREAFDPSDAREHAGIVGRRMGAVAHIEIWRRLPEGGAVVAVVTDDRPGLLSFICAALVVQEMDVLAAKAFTRRVPDGIAEAVDFFWIRRDASLALPVLRTDIARIRDVLCALIGGELTLASVVRRARPPRAAPPGASTRVTFDAGEGRALSVLTVETFDRPGLLLAITQALFRAGVQIASSDALSRDGRVIDTFLIEELDGSPVSPQKRGVVQVEVLSAIQALAQGML